MRSRWSPPERFHADLAAAIGAAAELTLVRATDDGEAEALLNDRFYREIGLEELARARGELALLSIGDGLSCDEPWGPCALALAERRFDRVIVLPAAVDASIPEVHDVLARTKATIFAEEPSPVALRAPQPSEDAIDRPDVIVLTAPHVRLHDDAAARLVSELDEHPDVLAVGARLRCPDGAVAECGGELRERDGVVEFRSGGQTEWLSNAAIAIRRKVLERFPIDEQLPGDHAGREWSYRVTMGRPGALRRIEEPIGDLIVEPQGLFEPKDFRARCVALSTLEALQQIHSRHGVLVASDLARIFPQLARPELDLRAASLLLKLLGAIGREEFLMLWCAGDLEPLLADDSQRLADRLARSDRELAELRRQLAAIRAARVWRLAGRYYRARERLRPRRR
jgi:hypothetical protein